MTELVERVWGHSLNNPDGFTLSLETLEPITSGICVAYLETQDSFGQESLQKVVSHALEHDKVIGGWLNPNNGQYYFDSVKVFQQGNHKEAEEFAKVNKQYGYYDLDNKITILVTE